MNPARVSELEGVRLAFAQCGTKGCRLVMLTPPIRAVQHKGRFELRWDPTEMPFRYEASPLLIDADGNSDFPGVRQMIRCVNRTT